MIQVPRIKVYIPNDAEATADAAAAIVAILDRDANIPPESVTQHAALPYNWQYWDDVASPTSDEGMNALYFDVDGTMSDFYNGVSHPPLTLAGLDAELQTMTGVVIVNGSAFINNTKLDAPDE
ncbi:MAG: hypothetical protein EOP56_09490 [Sphingobacteriales bacterium]|nr:MAG: hypothetical protein EOP56_09490 [Sphingobacteriales bacterium]